MVTLSREELIKELEEEAEKIHNSTRVDIPLFSPVHNYLRSKSETYYRWSISPKSNNIHRTAAWGFVVSVFFFTFVQFVFPNLFIPKPEKVQAASSTVTWTSQEDFEGNASTTSDATTRSQVDTAVSNGDVKLGSSSVGDLGTGIDCDATIATGNSATIQAIYENASVTGVTLANCSNPSLNGTDKGLAYGVGTYNAAGSTIPNFNSITINGTLTTSALVMINFKTKTTVTINSSGSINANGLGYAVASGPGVGGGSAYGFRGGSYYGRGGGTNQTCSDPGGGLGTGSTYPYSTSAFGSGGHSSFFGGGPGGGAVRINTLNLVNAGGIYANGTGGGSSGGSVFITSVGTITNSGSMTANGTNGVPNTSFTVGGGGGGLVKLEALSLNNTGGISVGAGAGVGSGNYYGCPGVGGSYSFTTITPYFTTGTIGETGPGLRFDAGVGKKAKWGSLRSITNIPSGRSVKVQYRTFNDDWTTPVNAYSGTWSDLPDGDNTGTGTGAVSLSSLSASRRIEVKVQLNGNGMVNDPTLSEMKILYDSLESPVNSGLTLSKTDGTPLKDSLGNTISAGVPAAWSNSTNLRLTASGLTCTGCATSTNMRPEVEIQPIGTAFTGTPTASATGSNTYVDISNLSPGTGYHLQVRSIDDQGRVSGWTSYGNNDESLADITPEQTAPTISAFTIGGANVSGSYAKSQSVTLSLTASDTGGSNLSQMRFSNDSTTWSDWETYATTKDWTLSSGDGAKNVYAQVVDNGGNVNGLIQTSDGDFNGGLTKTNITIGNGATALTANPDASHWYAGRAGTAMAGKYVYYVDAAGQTSMTWDTGVSTCSALSGRLPTLSELTELDAGAASYGANFHTGNYWSSDESGTSAWKRFFFSHTNTLASKSNTFLVRCVTSSAVSSYLTPGTFESSILDSTSASMKYGNLNYATNLPSGTTITLSVRGGNTATPDGTWTTYSDIASGGSLSTLNDHRYLQYRAVLTGGSATPTLYDVSFGATSSAPPITLDTTKPTLDVDTITSPQGLETWVGGTSHDITWDNTKIADSNSGLTPTPLILKFTSNNGSSWSDIATGEANDGTYSDWKLPNVTCINTCRVGITAMDNAGNSTLITDANSTSNTFSMTADTTGPVWEAETSLDVSPKYTDGSSNIWTNAIPTLSWTPQATDTESGIDIYQVYTVGTPDTLKEDNLTNTSVTSNFSSGTYEWYPVALNGAAASTSTKDQLSLTQTIHVDTTAPTGTLSITPQANSGITATKSNTVNLSVSGITDADSGFKEVSFSNSSSGPWTSFQSSTSYASWNLSDALYGGTTSRGTKTVYFRLKDNVGNVADASSSTIMWEDTAPGHPSPSASSTVNNQSTYANNAWQGASTTTISFSAPTDAAPSSGIYQYRIYRSQDSANAADASLQSTQAGLSYDDSGLIDGHTYYYWVQATDNALNSSNYLVGAPYAEVVLPDITAPAQAQNFTAVGSATDQITVSFNSAPENSTSHSGKANSYTVTRTANGAIGSTEPQLDPTNYTYSVTSANISFENPTYFTSPDTYSFVDTVNAQEWYYYRVRATDESSLTSTYTYYKAKGNFASIFNQDDISVSVNNSHTKDTVAPGDIVTTTFKVTDDEGRTDLDTGNAFEGVRIQDGALTEVLAYTQITSKTNLTENSRDGYTYTYSYTVPSASAYGTYTISINVKDSVAVGNPGDNAHNQLKQVQFKLIPQAPVNLVAMGYTSTSVNLTWQAPGSAGNQVGLRTSQVYSVERKLLTEPDSSFAHIAYSNQASLTDTGRVIDTSYTYRVRAFDVSNNAGLYSGTSSTTTPKPTVPSIAAVKDASSQDMSLGGTYPIRYLITWGQISDSNTPDFRGYAIFRSTNGVWEGSPIAQINCIALGFNQTYYLDVHPQGDVNNIYQYRIATWDNSGNIGDSIETLSTVATQAPQLVTQPTATESGVSWVKLTWKSDQSSSGLVKYKKTSDSEYRDGSADYKPSVVQDNGSYVHTVIVSGLEKGTSYEFVVMSLNQSKLLSSESSSVTTSTKSFDISSIDKKTTATGATLSWSTGDVTSEGYVEYKKGNEQTKVAGTGKNATSHSVIISDLSPGDYVFTLKNIDPEGNVATSSLGSFTITGFDAGTLSSPQAGQIAEKDITATSAKITWASTIPTTSWIDYGTSSGAYTNSAGNNSMTLDHVVTLENLVPGTVYYYIVRGKDSNGTEYKSKETSFTAQSKPGVSEVRVYQITPYSARISINATKDVEASFTYGKDGQLDLKAGDTTVAKVHDLELSDLSDNTTYSYYVDIKDAQGNTARSEQGTFTTPLDKTPAEIKDVKLTPLSGSDSSKRGIIITWTTNKEATSQVAYGSGIAAGKYSQKSPEDTSLSLSHTVVINSLNPGTTYHFQLLSKDKRGNIAQSPDYTMLTQPQDESVLNLILKTLEDTFSWVGKVGSWFGGVFSQLFSK